MFFFLFLASVLVIQSCEPEVALDNTENLVVPQIPPVEMLTVPTERVAHADSLMTSEDRNGTKENWIHAGVSLLVWHGAIVLHSITPFSAIGAAFNQQAEYIGNSTFEWAYEYTDQLNGQRYDVSLTAQYINNNTEVEWKLNVSQAGGFTDVVWVSGIVDVSVTRATFTLFKDPNNPQAYLSIESERDLTNNEVSVRYTNILTGDPANGHYIQYTARNNNYLNRAFQVSRAANDLLDIEWNDPASDGRVRHPLRFNDTEWHCWDINKDDIDCN